MVKNRTSDAGHKTAVEAIVLAAGSSTRFGDRKLLSLLHGKPLLMYALEAACGSQCRRVILVVNRFLLGELTAVQDRVTVVLNEQAEDGMGSSISCGVRNSINSDAVVLLAADQPLVSTALIDSIIDSSVLHPASIVVSSFHGVTRNPALFPKEYYGELTNLQGDRGAKHIIEKHSENVSRIELSDEEQLLDVDTAADLERVRSIVAERKKAVFR